MGSQQLHENDDRAALGDHGAEHPFQRVGLEVCDAGPGPLPQGFDAGLGLLPQCLDVPLYGLDVGLGRQVAVEQVTCLFARASACSSVNPFSVKRLTNRWMSNAMASLMGRF